MSKVIATVASILIVAVVVVLIWWQPSQGRATAAPSPTTQRVAEQNLDANGNIKVHEQGGRVINVVQNVTVPVQSDLTPLGGFIDVRDCAALDTFVEAS